MATKYVRGAGSGLWNDNTAWSTTSSAGAANTTKAVAADAAILDAGSPATVEVDTVNQACLSIVCTGFTGTLLFTSFNLTTTSTVTLVAAMTLTPGTATWSMSGTTTITGASKHFYNVNFGGGTLTLANTLEVDNVLSWSSSTAIATSDINCYGLSGNGVSAFFTGAGRTINLKGGTWTGTSSSAPMQVNVTITGSVTMATNALYGLNGTSPVLNSSGATLTFTGTFCAYYAFTLTDSTTNWSTATLSTFNGNAASVGSTITLSQTTTILNLTIFGTSGNITLTTNDLIITGNLTTTSTGYVAAGRTITMTGASGTATWSMGGAGYIGSNLTITGAVTISGNVYYRTGTINTSAATITWAGTFNVSGSCTLTDNNAGTPNWALGSMNFTVSVTLTLSQTTTILNLSNLSANTMTLAFNDFVVKGNLTFVAGIIGTRTITLTGESGTATITGNATSNTGINIVLLAGANTITFSGSSNYNGSITYTSGIIITTGSTIFIGSTVTLNTDGIVWNNITRQGGGGTTTLGSALTCTGLFTFSNTQIFSGNYLVTAGSISQAAITMTLSASITCTGTYTNTGASIINGAFTLSVGGLNIPYNVTGTTAISLAGTWTGAGTLSKALTIAGDVVITGTVYYGGSTLIRTAGTITGGTLTFNAPCAINGSVTIDSEVAAYNADLTANASMTVGSLTLYYLSSLTMPAGSVLTVTTFLKIDNATLQSDTPSTPFTLTYNGTILNHQSAFATMIDVVATTTLYIWNAQELTRTTNIINIYDMDIGRVMSPPLFILLQSCNAI